MKKINKKIVVAMSGGLDSSVAAALLKKGGFEVVGVFLKLADLPTFKENEKRAKRIAKILKIPFLVLDLRKEFKKRIVDYFLKENKQGLTPNPCVVCNKEIKFGLLLEKALKLNADFIATGHYARTNLFKNFTIPSNSEGGRRKLAFFALVKNLKKIKLMKGRDKNKDQSYFLWMLNQKQLKRVLFPIGDYTRKEVEGLAKKFKLPFSGVKKSQEICFIKSTINEFLKKYLKTKPGHIVDINGKILEKHEGLYFYTIGQRKGIGLSGGPYYVLNKDLKRNLLIVTKNEKDLYKKELSVKKVNWISGKEPKLPLKVKAKIRYRHKASPATVYKILNTKYKILLSSPQRAITPGQSLVFYKREELLGGGIIC
jgi:tRNA-specific 2-thiouridylase